MIESSRSSATALSLTRTSTSDARTRGAIDTSEGPPERFFELLISEPAPRPTIRIIRYSSEKGVLKSLPPTSAGPLPATLVRPDDRQSVLQFALWAQTGRVTSALDGLYDLLDELCLAGEFARCDHLLADLTPQETGTQIAEGMLTITLYHRQRLPHWTPFLDAAEKHEAQSDPDAAREIFGRFRRLPDMADEGA